MKKQLATIALATVLGFSGAQADNVVNEVLGDISITTTVAFESEYVFRGIRQYGPAMQPAIDISKPVFEGEAYISYWGSYSVSNGGAGSESTDYSETDFIVGYTQSITNHFSIDGGYTYYGFFDNGSNGATPPEFAADRWHEVYLGLTADGLFPEGMPELSPSIYAYWNPTLDGWVFEGTIGHSIDLDEFFGSNWSLDLGANLGFVSTDDANSDQVAGTPKDGYSYWGATGDIVYTFNEVASWSVGIRYAANNNDSQRTVNPSVLGLGDAPDSTIYWGTSVSFGF